MSVLSVEKSGSCGSQQDVLDVLVGLRALLVLRASAVPVAANAVDNGLGDDNYNVCDCLVYAINDEQPLVTWSRRLSGISHERTLAAAKVLEDPRDRPKVWLRRRYDLSPGAQRPHGLSALWSYGHKLTMCIGRCTAERSGHDL